LIRQNFVGKVMSPLFNMQSRLVITFLPRSKRLLISWHPVPSLHGKIDGETVADFIFWGSKITVDGNCNHEIKRRLLLGRKVMTNRDCILKSGDITLPTKFCLIKAVVFPLIIYGCELDKKKAGR